MIKSTLKNRCLYQMMVRWVLIIWKLKEGNCTLHVCHFAFRHREELFTSGLLCFSAWQILSSCFASHKKSLQHILMLLLRDNYVAIKIFAIYMETLQRYISPMYVTIKIVATASDRAKKTQCQEDITSPPFSISVCHGSHTSFPDLCKICNRSSSQLQSTISIFITKIRCPMLVLSVVLP